MFIPVADYQLKCKLQLVYGNKKFYRPLYHDKRELMKLSKEQLRKVLVNLRGADGGARIAPSKKDAVRAIARVLDRRSTCSSRKSGRRYHRSPRLPYKKLVTPCRVGLEDPVGKIIVEMSKCKYPDDVGYCPLCYILNNRDSARLNEPIFDFQGLVWRSYVVIPNAFPYFNDHLLITVNTHNYGQPSASFRKNGTQDDMHGRIAVVGDMLDFASIAVNDKRGTLFFNGRCGNSLPHFHVQYTSDKFPVFEKLRLGEFDRYPSKDGALELFHDGGRFYTGFFFTAQDGVSSRGALSRKLYRLFHHLLDRGLLYNMIIDKEGATIMVVVYVRRCRDIDMHGVVDLEYGAPELSGVIGHNSLAEFADYGTIKKYLMYTNPVSIYMDVLEDL
uniref:Uncharacterized protein n=1 Tax=Marseillevirus LCMAC103 TaxID=2506604 RepID=A0A481YTY4_9VIRU|nr:MAG: hypothetical protein LCMAC103_01150 [Marseillevirus LCMAC103]